MTNDLLTTHNLTFFNPTTGTLDTSGNYIPGVPVQVDDILGSLQPMDEGTKMYYLPEGIQTDSAYFFYTTEDLQVGSEFDGALPAYTILKGREHEVHTNADWTGFGLSIEHKEYMLIGRATKAEGNG